MVTVENVTSFNTFLLIALAVMYLYTGRLWFERCLERWAELDGEQCYFVTAAKIGLPTRAARIEHILTRELLIVFWVPAMLFTWVCIMIGQSRAARDLHPN